MKVFKARFMPGENIPGKANVALSAGTFVKLAGTKTSDGDYLITTCGAGQLALGVVESDSGDPATQDSSSAELRVNVVRAGAVARVVPSAGLAYGTLVTSDANGKAKAAGTGDQILGMVMATCLNTDPFVEVVLFDGGVHA